MLSAVEHKKSDTGKDLSKQFDELGVKWKLNKANV